MDKFFFHSLIMFEQREKASWWNKVEPLHRQAERK